MSNNAIEKYALSSTLRSYEAIIDAIEKKFGVNSSVKHPALVSTLLRFQEEMIKSTTELVIANKLNIDDIKNSLK